MERRIINKESTSIGKTRDKNDDSIYIGKDYAAVIDGVSHKSTIKTPNGEIKIAEIITKAIEKIDGTTYAEILDFNEFVKYVNRYIANYLEKHNMPEKIGEMEATGVIYSKHKNQIWLVGDCRAIYDGKIVKNPLKIDDVVIDIRVQLVKALMEAGFSEQELEENDISKQIITKPELLSKYIKDKKAQERITEYRTQRIKQALLECGFSEKDIEELDLITTYYNPRTLQAYLKNNPNAGEYGYAIFNGKYTEIKNCKVEQLPDDVKTIKLFSDGFSIDALSKDKDVGVAIRKMWAKAKEDPLSLEKNRATHPSKQYSNRAKGERAIDDRSAVVIEIAREEKNIDER